MVGASLASTARRWSRPRRLLALLLALLLVFGLSIAGGNALDVSIARADLAPASGLIAVLALIARQGWRIPITTAGVTAVAIGNLVTGLPVDYVLQTGLLRILEILLFCAIVERSGRLPRLDSAAHSVRLVIGATIASAFFAVGVTAVRLLAGVELAEAFANDAFVANLVSFVVATPLAFARVRQGATASRTEVTAQWLLMAAALIVTFTLSVNISLSFLPLPLFAWAALRLSAIGVTLQLLLVTLGTTIATILGWGPFAANADGVRDAIVVLQGGLFIFLSSTLVLWSKRVEGELEIERALAKDRVLRRAVEQAQTAFLLVEPIGDAYIVVQANDHGLRALGMDPDNAFFSASSEINIALPEDHPLIEGLSIVAGGEPRWRGELVLEAFAGRADAEVAIERAAGDKSGVMSVELTDVTEKRREDRRLRALVERERALSAQYQELSRQKDDFVASISHELRTPLASIVGYAETLDETELDPMQRRFVDTIVRNAGRLQERVEELLSAAKRAADSVDDPHPLALDRIIGEVADDLRAVAASRRVDIVVESSATALPEVIGTEDSVTRVLTNIMSNAVKFSPDDSSVVLSALVDDETIELFVRDAGPGIPLADQERVFDRFYRTEDATANATPGTGLGLSIVRTLLDGIGGSVLVESDGEHGSTFIVRFARAHDLDPAL
ncbi:MAG: ATP-binding protein [Microcella sp.]|uniref:sensor histidine kinase n=1 Tax=Microcella sp. TaxID=1913979 RepID=UPI00271D32BD|nr:ATP-binding protein [Microcella sp.]MDO8337100.1 ATP-binding protein [Microcella sp.]